MNLDEAKDRWLDAVQVATKQLKRRRELLGLSVDEVAAAVGGDSFWLVRLEDDPDLSVQLEDLVDIAKALDARWQLWLTAADESMVLRLLGERSLSERMRRGLLMMMDWRDCNQIALGKRIDLTQPNVSRILNGRKPLLPERIVAFCAALDFFVSFELEVGFEEVLR